MTEGLAVSVLEVHDVSVRYITGDFKDIGLKEYMMKKLRGEYHVAEFWADRNISFTLDKGEMLGIIGTNGAGKSTLLKAVSGIMEPTEGYVKRRGNIAALLELASGFDGDLTVRENTYLRGAMLGYTRMFMDETYDRIIDFAELRDFQDRPFRQLSSGMKSRLAFSIASLVQPDILILDEVLSVGDGAFRKKSEEKMREIIAGGAATILVSHSIQQVQNLCTKVLWIEKGQQIALSDDVERICNLYQDYLGKKVLLKDLLDIAPRLTLEKEAGLKGMELKAAAGKKPADEKVQLRRETELGTADERGNKQSGILSISVLSKEMKKALLWDAITFLLIGVISFVFSLQASNDIWSKGNTRIDSSVFKYVARVILKGGMPYLDAFDHKGPLIYLINVLGIQIAKWRGIWVLELFAVFVTFYFMYKIARIYTGRAMSIFLLLIGSCPLFSYFEGGNLTEEYAMPFIAISLYIFVDYFVKSHVNVFRLVTCGFSFGAVLMLRPNMCSTWIVMCLGVLIKCILSKELQQLWSFIMYFTAGALILIAPILLWLAANGAFGAFVSSYIAFNMSYSSATIVEKAGSFIYFANHVLVLFSVCGLSCVCVRKKHYLDILYLIYIFTTLLLICISGQHYNHYGMVVVPALIYPFARMISALKENMPNLLVIDFFVVFFLVMFAASGWLGAIQNAVTEYETKDELHFGLKEMETANLVVSHSTEEDEIIVLGSWDIIYNLSDRFAASKYSYQLPPLNIDSNRAEEFYQEIESNKPKLIVLPSKGAFAYDWIIHFIEENNYYEVGKTTDRTVVVYGRGE